MYPWLISIPTVLAAGGLTAYGAVHPAAQLFGPVVRRTNSPRQLAITFDDGPNPSVTPQLLDLLDRHRAHATFFLIGRFARQCPDLVREIAARGHDIGNHTETHPNLFYLSATQIRDELQRCNDVLTGLIGASPEWFRPPFGLRNPWLAPAARQLKLKVVTWTTIPGDWLANSRPEGWLIQRMQLIAQRAQHLREQPHSAPRFGDVLCLHDGNHRLLNGDRMRTVQALEYWLPRWSDLGLQFVTMKEAVRTPAA